MVYKTNKNREGFRPAVFREVLKEGGLELDLFEFRPDIRINGGVQLHSRFSRIGHDTFIHDAVPDDLMASALIHDNGLHHIVRSSVLEYAPGRSVKLSIPVVGGMLLIDDDVVAEYELKECREG
ncbi:hypothetical protein [Devosia sp.]|uniref:hypothetical protein n=1 Tax=Devosia sp. TaxID=1871048 RepID=UPI0027376245|nr:hypothetical protein [Devosia sp.]MDP2782263.1 hypothetical protein [Devosia sp.]